MMKMNKFTIINAYLTTLFKEPKCELNFNHDYELLIAVMLSAQSTDKVVNSVTKPLFKKYSTLKELYDADITDIENIIKPVGTYHKKSIFIKEIAKQLIENFNGQVPNNKASLIAMPGIGNKTSNVVLNILYNESTLGVDTHIFRVSKRLGLVKKTDNILTTEKKLLKLIPQNEIGNTHLRLVLFGRYYCKALKPLCEECQLKNICKK